jgi:ketosteroid isomerase-like protein
MPDENESLVRQAYEAYGRGDVTQILELVDPDLEWTYLDPSFENPEPQTCHGRQELRQALQRRAEQGLRSELEEIAVSGDKVMVVVRTPGLDRLRVRQADDRNYMVLTLRNGRIIAMRDCRDRDEAYGFAGIDSNPQS